MKKKHLVAVGIVLALVAFVVMLWVNEGPLWRLVMLTKVPFVVLDYDDMHDQHVHKGHWIRGWFWGKRWSRLRKLDDWGTEFYGMRTPVKAIGYFVENGFKALDWNLFPGKGMQNTYWKLDGTVYWQSYSVGDDRKPLRPGRDKFLPPWLWGVTDQTEPTAPWWNEEQ